MSLTQRTTKLVLATCLACLLAYFLDLSSAVSAGIIALLSLSDTRRSTLKLARNRLFSMLLALAIGVLAFQLTGAWASIWLSMYLLLTKWAGKSASPLAVSWSAISWYRSLPLQSSCLMKCSSFSSGQALLYWSTFICPLVRKPSKATTFRSKKS